jgi:nicotinamidase-related amidase
VKRSGTVVVTGLVTHGCVQAGCLDAHRLGYRVILPRDGHSNFNRQAAKLVDEWNAKLAEQGIAVIPADEVSFAGEPS